MFCVALAGRPVKLLGLLVGLWAGLSVAHAQPDYAPALWNPAYPGHWYTTGYGRWFCVIHDMEGYYESTISYFKQSGTSASVHYCVNSLQNGSGENNPNDAPAGQITQMVREQYWAWHVSCWNRYMFGTEHEGFVSNPAWYSEAMYQASAGLQRHLCQTYGIPMDRNHIIGHNEWQNSAWKAWMAANYPQIDTTCNNHTDPGIYWNWGHFMQLITGGPPPTITTQPASLTVAQGATAGFTVVATGTGTLKYQWKFNQVAIPGAIGTSYTIGSAQPANAGGYSVVVTNQNGATTSSVAFLSVLSPLVNAPGSIVAPSGLTDWWPADGNANDLLGPWNGVPANGFSYSPGRQGLAFRFDGSTSYLHTSAPSLPAPWTVCCWVNRLNAPGSAAALMSDGTYSLKLEQYDGTRKVGVTQLGVGDYTFGYTAPVGAWVHLAFVGTGSQTLLYANGALQGSLSINVPLPRAYLGATYVSSGSRVVDYLLASLDEVLVFNRALSAAEIGSIYSAGSAGLCRAPEFTGAQPLGNSQFQLQVRGLTGKSFTFYGSTNLLNWATLATKPNPAGTILYTDSIASLPRRFYRVSQP